MIDGEAIGRSQLEDDLSERAGNQTLIDLVLDRRLDAEIRRRGIRIGDEHMREEEDRFIRAMSDLSTDAPSYRLIDRIKRSRGLGPDRYPRFLRRSAMLRALVGEAATPSEAELTLAQRIAFGPLCVIRIFVSADERSVIELRDTLLAAPAESRRWIFADACAGRSIHPSAPGGGLIEGFSADDPAYPRVLSDAVDAAPIGGLTGVLATDSGFVLALVESRTPAREPSAAEIRSVREQLTSRKARVEMQRLADELLGEARVSVMDRSLNWSWTNRP